MSIVRERPLEARKGVYNAYMRIAVVSYDYSPAIGGMGDCIRQSLVELRTLHPDHQWLVVSPSTNADIRVGGLARARWRKPFGCPLFSLSLFFSLHRILRTHSIDLVHIHAGSGGAFLLRKPFVPLLVTAHHTYMQEVRYVFQYRPLKRLTKWLMSLAERRTYQLAERITAVSADTRDALINDYGIDPKKIIVIENAVTVMDTASTSPTHPVILSIGRLEARKGTEVLLRAFQVFRLHYPNAELRLAGTNLMGEALQRLLDELGITSSVSLLGFIDTESMFRELRSATCIVVPSLLEGFGLLAAQAMMVGACVIVSDAPGLRSLVKHESTGLVFPSSDAPALAREMMKAAQNSTLRTQLGDAAKGDALARFSLTKRTADLFSEYLKLSHE